MQTSAAQMAPSTFADPFPPIPPAFVPGGTDAGSIAFLEPLFENLEKREIGSAAQLEKWLVDWSELSSVIGEEESKRYIDSTCRTDDPVVQKRHMDFQKEIAPFAKRKAQALKEKYAASPWRGKLDPKRYEVFDRAIRTEIALYRDENIPLETRETELVTAWQQVSGAQMAAFDGEERTLQQMGRYLEETDRTVRQRAWEAIARRRLQDRDAIDALYDEMIGLRDRIAKNAGFPDYREYIFKARGRFDYTPADCERFHDAVEKLVVPLLRRLHGERRKKLAVDVLRPWDLGVDPDGAAPLRPFETVDQLVAGVRQIYHKVSPELAELFEAIRRKGNLDLDSRKGKAPGGYQATLDVQRAPFIFMNAAGLNKDVMTLLHEGGHAFHATFARNDPLIQYRSAPLEFAEVASMGMEALAIDEIGVFYSPADAKRARRDFFDKVVDLLAWIATIDSFQHWVYLHPQHTRQERIDAWLGARKRFMGADDWAGHEEAHAYRWHAQMHIFCAPFYYIEYAVAQIGALQLWLNARRDRAGALARYKQGLSLGGSRPLPELFAATGLKFGLDAGTLKPLVEAVEREL